MESQMAGSSKNVGFKVEPREDGIELDFRHIM